MSIENVVIPQLGESITEATVGNWMKKVGDVVAMDEPIVELETDKVAMEVPAPVAGVIVELTAAEGDTVEIGALIAKIDTDGKAAAKKPAAKAEAPKAEAPKAEAPKAEAVTEPAPEKAEPAKAAEQTSATPSAVIAMSPAVRRLVENYNLDPNSISTTGTGKDERLTKADVLKAIEAGTAKTLGTVVTSATPAADSGPREERIKMTRMRKRIAERLKDAQNTAAMLTTYNEVDMTAIIAARAKYKDLFEKKHNIRLGFMGFFVKACTLALKEVPEVNAFIEGDEIVYHNYANIGVAVSAPNGLVVPVLRDAQNMSFAECESGIAHYGKKARDGKLALEDMQGGTFTVSNGGVFGSLMSSPILNPPQSGILGMHKIQQRAMVMEDGSIQARPMMYVALSYDHRIVDGSGAVTFLVRVKEALEDPTRLLLDM